MKISYFTAIALILAAPAALSNVGCSDGGVCLLVLEGSAALPDGDSCPSHDVHVKAPGTLGAPTNGAVCAGPETTLCSTSSLRKQGCATVDTGLRLDVSTLQEMMHAEGLGSRLRRRLMSTIDVSFGGKRLKTSEQLAGFPHSTILKPAESLVIALDGDASYSDFSLLPRGDTEPLYTVVAPLERLEIPTAHLEHGAALEWRITVDGRLYEGPFSIALLEDQAAFESELRDLPGFDALPRDARNVLRALQADEWDYTFDAIQLAHPYLEVGADNE